MKRINFNFLLILLGLSSILGMCSKEDAIGNDPTQTPVVMQVSKGLLATIGINGIGLTDTIHFRNTTSFTHPALFSYEGSYDFPASGWYVRPRDSWELLNSGTNNWHIKNGSGYYLGYRENLNASGEDRYTITLDLAPGDNHLFVMNKTGERNFYIQPVTNKNVYLTSLPANVQPPIPQHKKGRFLEATKQLWFLIP